MKDELKDLGPCGLTVRGEEGAAANHDGRTLDELMDDYDLQSQVLARWESRERACRGELDDLERRIDGFGHEARARLNDYLMSDAAGPPPGVGAGLCTCGSVNPPRG